ncbi:MAG: hypothetical protein Kapaf2KO_03590 [Candidatus Kapaibacteriales bacterium]
MNRFNRIKAVFALSILGCLAFFTSEVISNSNGKTSSLNGCSCHGSNNSATTVTITVVGGTTISVNEEVDIEVKVENSSFTKFGLNSAVVTSQSGTTKAGTLTAGTGTKISSSEITHNGAQTGSNNEFTFKYKWKAPATAGTYYVRAAGNAVDGTGGTGGNDRPNTATTVAITVEDSESVELTSGNGGKICADETFNITWNSSSVANVDISYSTDGGASFPNSITTNQAASAGSFSWSVPASIAGEDDVRIKITSSSDGSVTDESDSNIKVNAEPTIMMHPVGGSTCSGGDLTLSVTAEGGDLTYLWKKNGTTVPGANQATLQLNNTDSDDSGSYTVDISNGCGNTVTSNAATVTIDQSPLITVQPKSTSACLGEELVIAATAIGPADLKIEWFRDGNLISGQSDDTLRIANFANNLAGDYTMKISSVTCSEEKTSQIAKVSASPATNITNQQVGLTVCSGEDAIFFVTAEGSDLTYQWQKNGAIINGETNDTLTISSAEKADEATYKAIIRGKCGDPVFSQDMALTVKESFQITSATGPNDAKVGDQVTLNIAITGSADRFDWYKDGSFLSSSSQGELVIQSATLTDAGTYYAYVVSECDSTKSDDIVLDIQAADSPAASLSESVLDFDVVVVGESKNLSVKLTNTGKGSIVLSGIVLDGSAEFELIGMNTFPVSMEEGESFDYEFTFSPTTPGVQMTTATFNFDNLDSKELDLVGGAALSSVPTSVTAVGGTNVQLSVGETSDNEFYIVNNGPGELSIEDISYSVNILQGNLLVPEDEAIELSFDSGLRIEPGDTTFIAILFDSQNFEVGRYEIEFEIEYSTGQESESITYTLDNISSVEELTQSELNLYPNPATETISFDISGLRGNILKVSVLDINGEPTDISVPTERASASFNTSSLATGAYILVFEMSDGNRYFKRFTIKR